MLVTTIIFYVLFDSLYTTTSCQRLNANISILDCRFENLFWSLEKNDTNLVFIWILLFLMWFGIYNFKAYKAFLFF